MRRQRAATTVAVVGAGLVGRLTACTLAERGLKVALYDRGTPAGSDSCSNSAAGLLTPLYEAVYCEGGGESGFFALGQSSLSLWPETCARMQEPSPALPGCLVCGVSQEDVGAFAGRAERLRGVGPMRFLTPDELARIEPALAGSGLAGTLVEGEGAIEPAHLLEATLGRMRQLGVDSVWGTRVDVWPRRVQSQDAVARFDLVVDCRGLGARDDLPTLRGVRGELVEVYCPELDLVRPLRIVDLRAPVYIVPRTDHRFIIGATCLESESTRPATAGSVYELLREAIRYLPALREATLVGARAGVRPAFFDHQPRLISEPGLVRVNGLYRHGILLAPLFAAAATAVALTAALPAVLEPYCEVRDV